MHEIHVNLVMGGPFLLCLILAGTDNHPDITLRLAPIMKAWECPVMYGSHLPYHVNDLPWEGDENTRHTHSFNINRQHKLYVRLDTCNIL